MPDHPDTTDSVSAQEPAPDADNHFVGVTIDACAAIVDAKVLQLMGIQRSHDTHAIRFAIVQMQMVAEQIRSLKGHL